MNIVTVHLKTPKAEIKWQIIKDILDEQTRQDQLHGVKESLSLCDKNMISFYQKQEENCRHKTPQNWSDVLLEEVYEALSAPDLPSVRTELIHVAATTARIIQHIDLDLIKGSPDASD